jgi:hypothetical protein
VKIPDNFVNSASDNGNTRESERPSARVRHPDATKTNSNRAAAQYALASHWMAARRIRDQAVLEDLIAACGAGDSCVRTFRQMARSLKTNQDAVQSSMRRLIRSGVVRKEKGNPTNRYTLLARELSRSAYGTEDAP